MRQQDYHFIGLDVHKKTISYCIKRIDGRIVEEGRIESTEPALHDWASSLDYPWIGGLEATMFSHWIYYFLKPYASELYMGNPMELDSITKAKKKSDRGDALKLADLLRTDDLFPAIYVPPRKYWLLRMLMRYRNLLVRESVCLKNRSACLLMELGVEYNKQRLHGKRYFAELLSELEDIPDTVRFMLDVNRNEIDAFNAIQRKILRILMSDDEIRTRTDYLMSIGGVGQIMSLTWVCEIAELTRFSGIKKVQSYCGLVSRHDESAGRIKRGPISKNRNSHIQPVVIEASKLAPRYNEELASVHAKEIENGRNRNEATIAVARKLVSYMYAVDRDQRPFEKSNNESAF